MNNQMPMREAHRVEDLEEQTQPRRDAHAPGIAVRIDAFPGHQFEHQIRLAHRADARIHQMRDVWV